MKKNKLAIIQTLMIMVMAAVLCSCSGADEKQPEETEAVPSEIVLESEVNVTSESAAPAETEVQEAETTVNTEVAADPNVFYNDRLSLEFRVLNFNVYDDSNILEQEQYAEEYFIPGGYPDPDYVYIGIKWSQLREEHPEVDEYLNLDYDEQRNSDFNLDAFISSHRDEYVIEAHPDARYVFITFEVTNVTDNPLREALSQRLYIENDAIDYYGLNYIDTEALTYFDYRDDLNDSEWYHYASYYTFAPGESRTFTIGYTLYAWPYNDTPLVFTDNDRYYYCNPYIMEGETSPENLRRSVYLNDLPAAEYPAPVSGD